MLGRSPRRSRAISPGEHDEVRHQIVQTTLTSNGRVIDQDPTKFGRLRESTEHAADGIVLRERLSEDGYVFLRDVLDTQALLRVGNLSPTSYTGSTPSTLTAAAPRTPSQRNPACRYTK